MLSMVLGDRFRCFVVAGLACAALLAFPLAGSASEQKKPDAKRKADAGPPPAFRIEVAPLGFTAPSMFYLSARLASATLDFIDNDHLLFTFREGGLLQRLPEDPKEDEDQVVCALVLEIATGKVVQKAEWRMHDHQRYLWAIGGGEFLVRQRNALYLTDSRLELRPYMQFDSQLQSIDVAPDHKLMTVEFQKYERQAPSTDDPIGPPGMTVIRRPSTQIVILRPHDLTVIARSEAHHVVDVPLLQDGFLELLEGKRPDLWEIHAKPFAGASAVVGEVKSACTPTMISLSANVVLTVGCLGGTSDHAVTAFSAKGAVLWQNRWQPRYIWPTFEYAENGSRFAYGSLEINHSIGTMDPFGDDDVRGQMVGVFDTETGKLQLAKNASPVLSAGHNYTLTADGSRFAILREGAVEIYDLPPAVTTPAPAVAAAK
jgi:hypothetical protein